MAKTETPALAPAWKEPDLPKPLKREVWEALAIRLANLEKRAPAYAAVFPKCRPDLAQKNCDRLLRDHPEIGVRVQIIKVEIQAAMVRRGAMDREDLQELVMRNLERATNRGKPLYDGKEFVGWYTDYAAVNGCLKILGDLNGLTGRSRPQGRKEPTEAEKKAMLHPDQILASIMRKLAVADGKAPDDATVRDIERIAAAARAELGAGALQQEQVEVLPPVPEATPVP